MRHDVIIVGGGVSGLATGYWLRSQRPDLDVVVVEAGESAGGHVTSSLEEGFTVDWGPNALQAGAPDTRTLIESLGLSGDVVRAAPGSRRRFVVRRGALVAVPGSPGGLSASPLLDVRGKLRALLEPFVGRGGEDDESVSDFLRRRFGVSVAEAIGEVLVTGLVAGDPRRLSVGALFPRLTALERAHGSLLRGLLAQRRAARRTAGPGNPRAAAGLFTFSGGLGRLTATLGTALGPALRTGVSVRAVRPGEGGFFLELAQGTRLATSTVVLATPAHATADLVDSLDAGAARELRSIAYAGVGVAALGYERSKIPPLPDGFGFLAPRGQGLRSLGVQFSSATFPGQSPEGTILLRAIAGGTLDAGFLELDHAEAVAAVTRDLASTLQITAPPSFVRYRRLPDAIPQYETGHAARLDRLERALAPWPGVHLVGNAYRGVGVNDCLCEARALAGRLATAHAPRPA